jgi:hypothetical protein
MLVLSAHEPQSLRAGQVPMHLSCFAVVGGAGSLCTSLPMGLRGRALRPCCVGHTHCVSSLGGVGPMSCVECVNLFGGCRSLLSQPTVNCMHGIV